MKKDIRRFGKALIITISIIVILDVFVGVAADRITQFMPSFGSPLAKDNYRLHRMDAEIVIIGSSRGTHHYVTQILSDSLDAYYHKHHTIYNASIAKQFATSNLCCAEAIIARYKPKLVIFDLPEDHLREESFDDLELSSPYYWSDSVVRRYFDGCGFKERLLMKSGFYRYNCKLLKIADSFHKAVPEDDGYAPIYGMITDTVKSLVTATIDNKYNDYIVRNFENTMERYKSAGVPFIVVCSPRFRSNDSQALISSLCEKHAIPFIDLMDTPLFNRHPEWFRDPGHLNNYGAHVYTMGFFQYLKPYLPDLE